jgi:O-acetyl-ADP-ribose deacetylase (regulator of RNase III)
MHDDIFASICEALVNPINCVGVMGGGLAKQFRLRYWDMNKAYQDACARGEVKVGKMWQWWEQPLFQKDGTIREARWIINFPTKDDWRNPSKIEYIRDGMEDLVRVISDLHLSSIAIPGLGAGLGGLDWPEVEAVIHHGLRNVTAHVEIYPPEGRKYII